MHVKKHIVLTLAGAVLTAAAIAQPQGWVDPCTQNTPLTGAQFMSSKQNQSGSLGNTGYIYRSWYESGVNPTCSLWWYGANQGGGAAFRATWENSTDKRANYLARTGYAWNCNGQAYNNYKNIYSDYNFSASGTGGNWTYFGLYGWFISASNENQYHKVIEYYIMDNWFGNSQMGTGGTHLGNINVDGGTYRVEAKNTTWTASLGCAGTNNVPFMQVFSIRQYADNSGLNARRTCGTLSVTEHFKKWDELLKAHPNYGPNFELGKLFEVTFKVEVGGGTGEIDMRWLKFSQEDEPRPIVPKASVFRNQTVTAQSKKSTPISVIGKTLNVSQPDGVKLRIRVIDVKGKVRAKFDAAGTGSFSLAKIPSGRYFVEVTNAKVKQTTPIVIK